MPRKKNTRAAQGAGNIRKKTVTRGEKEYTFWEARVTVGRDPGTGKQIRRSFSGKTQKEVREKMQLHLSSKSRHKKAQLTEAQFGPVLNWASIAQSSSQTAVVEEVDVGVQQSWNIFCVGQIEVEEQFFFDPSVQSFYDRVICWSSYSRHGAKYVIILVGLAKSP